MDQKLRKIVLSIVVCIVFLLTNKEAFAKSDVKMFNSYTLKYKVNDKFDVFIQPDMRFKDNMGEFYYYHFRSGIVFHALKYLDLGTTYRFLQSKNSADKWLIENRLELDVTPKVTVKGFQLFNRSRFEYRWLESAKDRWRYRNCTKIAYPTSIKNFEFTPYISEEFFYDLRIGKVHLNWVTIGASKKITKNLILGLYYMVESLRVGKINKWNTNHVLGTTITVSF